MIDFTSKENKKRFGKNLEKAKRNYKKELKRVKDDFQKKYPFAKISDFRFYVHIADSGEVAKYPPIYIYYIEGCYNWRLGSVAFNDFSQACSTGARQKFGTRLFFVNHGIKFPFDPNHFRIFVNGEQSFSFQTNPLDTKFANLKRARDIRTLDLDKDDPYFASLMAAYVISQKTGVCTRHLTESRDVHKIVTSILRFYVWCHMSRFLRFPEKMEKYLTKKNLDFIKKNIPLRKTWRKRYHHRKETVSWWLRTQPNRANIQNAKIYGSKYGGAIGIMYEEIDEVLPADPANDWKKFFLTDSRGIKKSGQLLLQKAVKSYVYCVLSAQANTRWKIVGEGAKSLQTQEAFAKLAKETVVEDDDTVLISNMRTAVKATNVVLNLAILPRMILIPSDMLILKEKIPGYNNTLTMATKSMKFGKNPELNFSTERSEETAGSKESEQSEETTTPAALDVSAGLEDAEETEGTLSSESTKRSDENEVTEGTEEEKSSKAALLPNGSKKRQESLKKSLGYSIGSEKNKEFVMVFTATSLLGTLGL